LLLYFYLDRFERNAEAEATGRTKFLPIAGIRAQPMVDVDGGELVAELGRKPVQDMQQDDGIDSA
jgi:hypothetical protein